MSDPLIPDLTDEQCDAALKFAASIGARNSAALTLLGEAFSAAIVECMGPNPSEERIILAIGHAANAVAHGLHARVLLTRETMQ